MSVADRIRQLRINKNLTQSDLAEQVGLTYIQVGRYEKGKSNPSASILQKLAVALDTTTDFLMNGTNEQIAEQMDDKELLKQFVEIEKLNADDKNVIKKFLDAFITKNKMQAILK
jgi:transcriptional regulator with XRE-family HTH domain